MKVKFDLPHGMEMKNLKHTDNGLEWDVVALRGQNAVGAGYLTVSGTGGRENKVVLRLNVRSGAVQALKPAQLEQPTVDFDLTPDQLKERKASRKNNLPQAKKKEPSHGAPAGTTH